MKEHTSAHYFGMRLAAAIQWRADVEHAPNAKSGEIPWGSYAWDHMECVDKYDPTYLGFRGCVLQKELNAICEAANLYYNMMGSSMRIGNSMGELRPARAG